MYKILTPTQRRKMNTEIQRQLRLAELQKEQPNKNIENEEE